MLSTASSTASSTAAWHGLELRHLTALVAVADAGTISRAAERLGYTQIGGQPADRRPREGRRQPGVRPSRRPPPAAPSPPVGDALLVHARTVLAQLRLAEADIDAVVAGEQGTLRVGTVQSVGTRILPDVLTRFHGERPRVRGRAARVARPR